MSLTDEQRAFAAAHRVAHLATADAGGSPHVVPLCYAVDEDAIYFVIDEKPKASRRPRRLRNLDENPRAAVVIDDYDDEWRHLAYLLLQGPATRVDDAEEYTRAVALLRQRYAPYRDMALDPERNAMVRIRIERAHLWRMVPAP